VQCHKLRQVPAAGRIAGVDNRLFNAGCELARVMQAPSINTDLREAVLYLLPAFLFLAAICAYPGRKTDVRHDVEVFQTINSRNSVIGDVVFSQLTHLGDGLLIGGIAVLLLVRAKHIAAALSIVPMLILLSVIVNTLKTGLHVPRPAGKLGIENIHYLLDVPATSNSMPSGHMTSAAAIGLFLVCALHLNSGWQFVLSVVVIAVGYSRIYLGMHWPTDIAVGWVLGLLIAYVSMLAIANPVQRLLLRASQRTMLYVRYVLLGLASVAIGIAFTNHYIYRFYI
jgi:membrane-associated phospholipid phosphatase